MPQREAVRKANRSAKRYPAEDWSRIRVYGEEFNAALRRHVAHSLKQVGHAAIAPMLVPNWTIVKSQRFSYAASWSERHAAHAAGLGTFGLCDGLITARDKAMRVGSVVAKISIQPTPRPYSDHCAYCLLWPYVQTLAQKGAIMGLGMRIFIVNDDGSLERLPFVRYNRLIRHDLNERLPQYAGRRVRCAVIVVELKNSKPIEILKRQFSYLSFDSDGRLLTDGDESDARLAMDMLEPVIAGKDKQVVDARHKFARNRYAREYLWKTSPEIEQAIRKAIFGRFETGRG